MDDMAFDRFVRAWDASSARRQALKASIGGLFGLAVLGFGPGVMADDKKKKRKKQQGCLDQLESCDSTCRCCGGEEGDVACRQASAISCNRNFPGRRCCGLEGTPCEPNNLGCDCC